MLLVIAVVILLFLPWGTIYTATVAAAKRFAPSVPSFNPLTIKVELPLWKVLVLIVAFWLVSSGGGLKLPDFKLPNIPGFPSVPAIVAPGKPLVVMLYEASHGQLPPYVLGAANELVGGGYEVRPVDDDLLDGTGEVPEWLKPALEPGRKIMGGTDGKDYALVLLRGTTVAKSEKMPSTREAIIEAVK